MKPILSLACALAIGCIAVNARADDDKKMECASAYEQAQQLRAKGSLRAAREQLVVCADPACPEASRVDCTTWLGEVEQALPTLLLVVVGAAGQDVMEVDVKLDGQPFVSRLDGKAIPVDPGPHELELTIAGQPPLKKSIVMREGEKARRVEVSFVPPEKVVPPEPDSALDRIHPATWVLGAAGLAGVGLFGTMAGIGLAEKADAEETCAPVCDDATVESIQTKFLIGDIALAAGGASLIASLIVGIVSGTARPSSPDPATARLQLLVGPTPGGAFVGVGGSL